MRQTKAPWTKEQVNALLNYQLDARNHPYTCNKRHTLYPSENGLVCPECGYTQNWCYAEHLKEMIGWLS